MLEGNNVSFQDKVSTGLSLVIAVFISLALSFVVVWLCTAYWHDFPLTVQVFIGIVAVIPLYLVCLGLFYVTAHVIIKINDKRVIMPNEDGFYIQERGKLRGYPSLRGTNPVKQIGATSVVENVIDVPRLAVLLQDDMLLTDNNGETQVLLGYKSNNSPRYGKWPGCFAMLGIGNSGKSVSMLLFIVIAVLLGYEVIVCDPHKTKERSIYNKLKVLEGYVTFAFTPEEILAESQKFSYELKMKKTKGYDLDRKKLLVYDELTSIVKRNKEISQQIVVTVEEASQEGMGYYYNVMLACHGITLDAIGDIAIRNALNGVFCHRIDTDQSKYVIKDKKFNKKTGNLPSGHVFYRDELHDTEYLVMPYGDATDTTEALKLFQEKGIMPMGKVVTGSINAPYRKGMLSSPKGRDEIDTLPYQPVNNNKQHINEQTSRLGDVNTGMKPLQPNPLHVYGETDKTEAIQAEEAVNGTDVNGIVKIIQRMRKRNIPHRDIAYTVGLYGAKWPEYQQLCERYGIPLERIKEEA